MIKIIENMEKKLKKQTKTKYNAEAYERMILNYINSKPMRASKSEVYVYDESAKIGTRRLYR